MDCSILGIIIFRFVPHIVIFVIHHTYYIIQLIAVLSRIGSLLQKNEDRLIGSFRSHGHSLDRIVFNNNYILSRFINTDVFPKFPKIPLLLHELVSGRVF